MVRGGSKITSVVTLFFAAIGLTFAAPQVVSAAPGNPAYCDPAVDRLTNANFQTKVPVILVHGFSGKPQDWGSINDSTSFAGAINAIPGVAVAHVFGYNTLTWVDDPGSGPKLAKTIDCLAQLSSRNGGKGKVIVIGHSMGGLVAREALSHRSTDNQRSIADETGQVITIGTPHQGAMVTPPLNLLPLGRALSPGSPELAALPHFPSQTVVHTIAGDVIRVYRNIRGQEVRREQPFDDTLVKTTSALAEPASDANKGGGQKTFTCEKLYTSLGILNPNRYISRTTATCEHRQLISNAGNGVREDAAEAIRKYIAWLSAPPSVSLTIGGLTTTYDDRWENVGYGASGPGQDGSANDKTNGVPCDNCTVTPNPMVYAFVQIDNYASWCTGPILQCAIGSYPVVGAAPAVTIGGRTPDVSARYYDSGYTSTSLVWCFSDERVCVHYRRGTNAPQLEPSAALLDVFSSATWSNP